MSTQHAHIYNLNASCAILLTQTCLVTLRQVSNAMQQMVDWLTQWGSSASRASLLFKLMRLLVTMIWQLLTSCKQLRLVILHHKSLSVAFTASFHWHRLQHHEPVVQTQGTLLSRCNLMLLQACLLPLLRGSCAMFHIHVIARTLGPLLLQLQACKVVSPFRRRQPIGKFRKEGW